MAHCITPTFRKALQLYFYGVQATHTFVERKNVAVDLLHLETSALNRNRALYSTGSVNAYVSVDEYKEDVQAFLESFDKLLVFRFTILIFMA